MKYEPKNKSLKKHEVPEWFHDAKLGIFIHWGLYSVPAYATNLGVSIKDVVREEGFGGQFKNNPYAEWYCNTLRIEGSPTQKYHKETYGEDFSHDDFVPMFNEALKKWSPEEMVKTIKKSGARYVCLVTKHHDGFLLWHSDYPNPRKENYRASRDIVKELTEEVRKQGMKMAFYYSGTFDWSFQPNPIVDVTSFIKNGVMEPEYIEYANNHWYELIDKYGPKILWNDIGYPPGTDVKEIFAYYYNKHPDGLINDRWMQIGKRLRWFLGLYVPRKILKWAAKRAFLNGKASMPAFYHCDYTTPEYGVFSEISKKKWEQTRGIGQSFGYNQFEKEEHHLSFEQLIHEFCDLVSKNGNLLLNVGPMADGTIPEIQKIRLEQLGEWLEVNGEGIFGTRPWIRAEGITEDGIQVRFTRKKNELFAILLGRPSNDSVVIKDLNISNISRISILGYEEGLQYDQLQDDLIIPFPLGIVESPAYVIKIELKKK